MEQHRTIRCGGQVIEEYSRPFPAEVVETYSRPLPGSVQEPEKELPEPDAPKRSRQGLVIGLICLAVALTVSALALTLSTVLRLRRDFVRDGYSYYSYVDGPEDEEVYIKTILADADAALQITSGHGKELPAQEIYRKVNPAVVTVLAQIKGSSMMSVGTGVSFREDGYILTNHHVVAGCDECVVLMENDATFEARYVAGDADNDLAILKVNVTGLPVAEFGDSDALVVGDPVYAIGSPLRVEFRGTLTNGIVSAINRDVDMGDKSMTLIQTNAALNNGNSGGPLINSCGQVVGINVIKMYSDNSTVEGLGFAIPSSYLERVVNDLLTYGELQPEPMLGIWVMQEPDQLSENLRGLEIVDITEGSPADRAGVQVGDYLLAVDDTETLSSQAVLKARRKHHIGDDAVVTLWRNGEILEATLQLTDPVN